MIAIDLLPWQEDAFLCIDAFVCSYYYVVCLQKRNGVTSDGAEDDDSSSLSDRQGKGPPKGKKKFDARKFFRRMGTKSADDEVSITASYIFVSGSRIAVMAYPRFLYI